MRQYQTNAVELPDYVVLESIGDDEQLSPGFYVAGSDSQAFSVLSAMVAAGDAQYLGQRSDQPGQKYIAVAVGFSDREKGLAPNPTIGIGADFFSTALRTYGDYWPEAWWREVIQNSVDAGAHQIDCRVETLADGNVRASIEDNGGGMSREVLLDKFLVLGGTTKRGGAATGGFGKAKELIILPFVSWEIHTRDVRVYSTSSVIDYEVESAPYISGTRLSVVMPPDQCTTVVHCQRYLSRCYLPRIRFTVDGQSYQESDLRSGEVLREWPGKAQICYAQGNKRKARFPKEMLIRAHDASGRGSLFMWSVWVPEEIKGQLMVEVTGPTIELFNDSRQQWGDWELRYQIEDFVRELSADLSSALRRVERQPEVYTFSGPAGKFQAEAGELRQREMAALLESVGSGIAEGKQISKQVAEFSVEQIESLVQTVAQFDQFALQRGVRAPDEEGNPLNLSVNPDVAQVMLKTVAVRGPNHVEAVAKQMAWEPDFRLRSYSSSYRIPKRFYPEHMSRPVRKLARYWAEMCRFVMMLLGSSKPFGVGFLFDDGSDHPEGDIKGAEYEHDVDKDEDWLMLNPFSDGKAMKRTLKLSSQEELNWIFAAAVHECTHMANNVSSHTEVFAAALTVNMARTAGRTREIAKIKKLVLAQEREVAKRLSTDRSRKASRGPTVLSALRLALPGAPVGHQFAMAFEDHGEKGMFLDTLAKSGDESRWSWSRWEVAYGVRDMVRGAPESELRTLAGKMERLGVHQAIRDWGWDLVEESRMSDREAQRLLKRWGVVGATLVSYSPGSRFAAKPWVNMSGGGDVESVSGIERASNVDAALLEDRHTGSRFYEYMLRNADGSYSLYRVSEQAPVMEEALVRVGAGPSASSWRRITSILEWMNLDMLDAKRALVSSEGVEYVDGIDRQDAQLIMDDRWRS
jgi:hypothetical protein